MSKRLIYFAGIVLMAIAAIAVASAQEYTPILNNSADYLASNVSSNVSSNETLVIVPNETQNVTADENLNQTVQNEDVSVINETASAMNVTLQENATVPGAADSVAVAGGASQSEMSQTETGDNSVFSIGGGLASGNLFQVNGNNDPQQLFEINLPTKPIKDVSKVFFACNII